MCTSRAVRRGDHIRKPIWAAPVGVGTGLLRTRRVRGCKAQNQRHHLRIVSQQPSGRQSCEQNHEVWIPSEDVAKDGLSLLQPTKIGQSYGLPESQFWYG